MRNRRQELIYVDLNGRCGDQFFQYAFARKIQTRIKYNGPLQLNFFNQQRWKNKINDDTFRNDLCHFHIVDNNSFVDDTQNILRFGTKKQIRILKKYYFIRRVAKRLNIKWIAKLFQRHIQKNGIYYDDEYFSFFSYPKKNISVFIRGYFEDFHLYEDNELRKLLLEELKPIISNAGNNYLLKQIETTESVCVSMRSWKEVSQFDEVIKSRFICDKDYFINAIRKMKELLPNCSFFIFSDDSEFAKKNIGNSENFFFENDGNTIEDKIVLMSSCKHFIVSNSSFSWWNQYLSKNESKKVISPSRWYNDRVDNRLIKDDWIKL